MKYEDNSVHIGDKNKIKDSAIGQNSNNMKMGLIPDEKWHSKIFWKLLVPVAVIVLATVICLLLGLN